METGSKHKKINYAKIMQHEWDELVGGRNTNKVCINCSKKSKCVEGKRAYVVACGEGENIECQTSKGNAKKFLKKRGKRTKYGSKKVSKK